MTDERIGQWLARRDDTESNIERLEKELGWEKENLEICQRELYALTGCHCAFEGKNCKGHTDLLSNLPDKLVVSNELREKIRSCEEYLRRVALTDVLTCNRLRASWIRQMESLARLCENTGGELHSDFAPLSFCWSACGMFGGLIFHGYIELDKEGKVVGKEIDPLSVSLERIHGWSLHS